MRGNVQTWSHVYTTDSYGLIKIILEFRRSLFLYELAKSFTPVYSMEFWVW